MLGILNNPIINECSFVESSIVQSSFHRPLFAKALFKEGRFSVVEVQNRQFRNRRAIMKHAVREIVRAWYFLKEIRNFPYEQIYIYIHIYNLFTGNLRRAVSHEKDSF